MVIVRSPVTRVASPDKILFNVGAQPAAELRRMNFKMFSRATVLTPPSISFENLSTKLSAGIGIQS